MARYYQGVVLIVTAMLFVFCDAGHYQRRAMQQHYGYHGHHGHYQDEMANQQHYGYRDEIANQQHYGYRDDIANQQHYGYRDEIANQQHYGYRGDIANRQHYGYRDDIANQQADSCVLQLEAPSKTFTVCVKQNNDVCTSVAVPACSEGKTGCERIGKDDEALKAFEKDNPAVYAEECKDSSGAVCINTDVVYTTCSSQANAMADGKICIKLSNGEEKCSKISDLVKIAANEDVKSAQEIPPFKP